MTHSFASGNVVAVLTKTAGSNTISGVASGGQFTLDTLAPTLTSVAIDSDNTTSTDKAKSFDTITVSIESDEVLATPPTVSIAGQGATVTGSGTNWNAAITVAQFPTEGNAAISISGYADAAGNSGATVTSTSDGSFVEVDVTMPRLSTSNRKTPSERVVNSDSVEFRLTFNEPVTGVTASDFLFVGNPATTASITNVTIVSETTVDVTVSGGDLADYSGIFTMRIGSSRAIQDLAGNDLLTVNPITSAQSYAFDNEGVSVYSVTRRIPNTQITSSDTLEWTFAFTASGGATFDRSSVDANDFAVSGATGATITVSDGPGGGEVRVKASGGDLNNLNAVVTASISPAATILDTLGNNIASTVPTTTNNNSFTVQNDIIAPTVSITSLAADSVTEAFTAAFTFSEDVTGFVAGDVFVGNGAVTGFTATNASQYTALITPSSDGAVTVDVGAGAAQDGAGNDNLAGTQLSRTADVTAPTVTSITRGFFGPGQIPATTDVDVVSWFVKFSEDVTRPVAGDFSVTGTTSPVTISEVNADEYEISLASGDIATVNGTVTLNFSSGQTITDTAGNALNNVAPSGANDNHFIMANDILPPSAAITSSASDPVSGAFTVSVTFSEAVTGFVLGDIAVGNGAASSFSAVSPSVYTALITPASDGAVTVDVAAAAAQDGAGNPSAAAAQFSITNDTIAPTASTSPPPSSVNGPFDLTFSFTEDMSGLTASDFIVTNGTAVLSGGPREFVVTVTPDGNGDIALSLPANAATDPAGNGNEAFNATFDVVFDAVAPTVSTSTPPTSVNGAFDLVFSFTEDMTGLTASDFGVVNGTVTLSGGPREFTVTVTPDGNGDISVSLPADVATDPAGNGNEAFAATFQVEFDATAPTVTTSTPPAAANGPFDLVLSFTEDMTGLTADDFNVTNGTVVLSGGPREYTLTITPDGNGDLSVNLPADAATDPAGNGNDPFSARIEIVFDVAAPTLTLSTAVLDVTGPFTIMASFSEEVSGFTADDIAVTNGAVSDFSGSGSVFTATVTPDTIGNIIIVVADAAAQDQAGNAATGDTLSATASGGDVAVALDVSTDTLDASTVSKEFTLSNPGSQPIFFEASSNQPWVDVTPGSGQIDALANIDFDIQLNDLIDDLAPGTYVATVTVEVVDNLATSASTVSGNANAVIRNILAEVPITVNVEERFGNFELIVLTPTGPFAGASFEYASNVPALDGLSVSANEGEHRTTLPNLLQGAYTLEQAVPDGYRLNSIQCRGDRDGGTGVDLDAATVELDLDASESISCIFENVRDDDAIRIATQRAIRNFMARRGDRVLEAVPDLSKRFASRGRTEGGQFVASGSEFKTNMDFQVSMSGFRNRAAQKDDGPWNDILKPKSNRWDLWMSAEYTRYEDERADSGVDGKFFVAQFGADYLLKDNLIVGAMVQYDWMSELDKEPAPDLGTSVGAEVNGEGVMAGPYIVWQAQDQLTVDVMGLWGSSDNNVNPLGYYSDQFETDRFMVRANITGEFASGPWRLRPQVSLSHYEDKQGEYVDRLDIDIPEQVVTIGRLRAGPEIVWTHQTKTGSQLEIGGAIRAVWNYNGAGLMDQSGRISGGSDPVRADGDISIGTRLANGINIRATAGFDGIGQGDFSARSGRLEFVFPFGGKGGERTDANANPLTQAGFHRACETDGFLQSMNRAAPTACDAAPRANLLDTNIALMSAR